MGKQFIIAILGLTALFMNACASEVTKPTPTLYERLGGKEAIKMVINDFIDKLGSDKRITNQKIIDRVASIDVSKLKMHLTDQVCMATGGPCTYTGRSMKEAHAGMDITEAEFNIMVDDLVQTLNAYKVPKKEQDELLALLAPMKGDVVQAP
ncbi:group I truncated hemoglobin [Petrachloros mirabilis]